MDFQDKLIMIKSICRVSTYSPQT